MIYREFLKQYILGGISLTEDNFKIALFTSDYAPNSNNSKNDICYSDISQKGYELSGLNYDKGGKSFIFTGPVSLADDGDEIVRYQGQNTTWRNLTYQKLRYAIIYRDPKEDTTQLDYLVAYFDFGDDKSGTNRNFTLAWKGKYVLTISLSGPVGSSTSIIEVDSEFSNNSTNPVQNRLMTKALRALGVRLDGETFDSDLDTLNGIDQLSRVSSSDISSIFGESSPDDDDDKDDDDDDGTVKVKVDSSLSFDSTNPLTNKVTTSSLANVGVLLNGESLVDDTDVLEGQVDSLRGLDNSEIDAIFNKSTVIYISYVIDGLLTNLISNAYTVNSNLILPYVLSRTEKGETKNYLMPVEKDKVEEESDDDVLYDIEWFSNPNFYANSRVGKSNDSVSIKRNTFLYGRVLN